MKNKKIIITIVVVALVLIAGLVSYFVFFKQDKYTTLTFAEKQWIENNKNKLIDLSVINEVPIVSYNGEGIFFDFLNDLEKNTKLSFNKVAYKTSTDVKSEYALKVVDNYDNNAIKIYEDNYALVTKNNKVYSNIDEIKKLTVGVLNSKLTQVNDYLNTNSSLLLKSYDNYDDMIFDLLDAVEDDKKLDGVVLPKTAYLDSILEDDELTISYNISEMKDYYVLQLGSNSRLNDIIKKYYKKWNKESYDKTYNDQFFNGYFEFSTADDKQKVEFKSKRYVYGFVDNRPYDTLYDGKFLGINHSIISSFADFANIEIDYKKYASIDALIKDFNANNIDVFFNNTANETFLMDVSNSLSIYDEKIVVLTKPDSNYNIHSIASLKDKEVYTVGTSYINTYLSSKGVNTKVYKELKKMLADLHDDSIVVVDLETYNYYSEKNLKNFKVNYITDLNHDYYFTTRNITDNQTFAKLLDFYISFFSNNHDYELGYQEVLNIRDTKVSPRTIIFSVIGVVIAMICVFLGFKSTKPKKKQKVKSNLSKEDKIKYIDMLTSLKNRNYLNDNIEKWDSTGVYPQTVVIIDLNNIAYINDNYGHAEGDKIIGEAANILINTQLPNTEIIRTNGNEFLVYMVGYEEKQVISYTKKLTKEFKLLTHGFGAAIGYSMITDAIKTVDDAINEATTDMREQKEELDY